MYNINIFIFEWINVCDFYRRGEKMKVHTPLKRYSSSLIIRKMQIMRKQETILHPLVWQKWRHEAFPNVSMGVEQEGLFYMPQAAMRTGATTLENKLSVTSSASRPMPRNIPSSLPAPGAVYMTVHYSVTTATTTTKTEISQTHTGSHLQAKKGADFITGS